MNEKSYYTDAYTHQFKAVVQEIVTENGRFACRLDHTYFYPTSGGQPFDTGHINHIPVTEVTIREPDNAILHWLEDAPPEDKAVTAQINWPRRFDHMQQHSGQHILSQAFLRIAEAPTESFHLSDKSVTVDLGIDALTARQLSQVEQLANQTVWENRPIHVRLVSSSAAKKLPLRKIPPAQHDTLRLIDIEDFDLTACGGTHVAATGAVGLIKLIKGERRRGKVRVEFCCGGRALQDYQQKHTVLTDLTNTLTTSLSEISENIDKLRAENKQLQRTTKKQQAALLELKAVQLQQSAEKAGPLSVIAYVHDGQAAELRLLAQQLIKQPNTIALLGTTGPKTQLLFARSEDAPGDMNQLLKAAFAQLGSGSGGGKHNIAQGGGTAVSVAHLQQLLSSTKNQLLGK